MRHAVSVGARIALASPIRCITQVGPSSALRLAATKASRARSKVPAYEQGSAAFFRRIPPPRAPPATTPRKRDDQRTRRKRALGPAESRQSLSEDEEDAAAPSQLQQTKQRFNEYVQSDTQSEAGDLGFIETFTRLAFESFSDFKVYADHFWEIYTEQKADEVEPVTALWVARLYAKALKYCRSEYELRLKRTNRLQVIDEALPHGQVDIKRKSKAEEERALSILTDYQAALLRTCRAYAKRLPELVHESNDARRSAFGIISSSIVALFLRERDVELIDLLKPFVEFVSCRPNALPNLLWYRAGYYDLHDDSDAAVALAHDICERLRTATDPKDPFFRVKGKMTDHWPATDSFITGQKGYVSILQSRSSIFNPIAYESIIQTKPLNTLAVIVTMLLRLRDERASDILDLAFRALDPTVFHLILERFVVVLVEQGSATEIDGLRQRMLALAHVKDLRLSSCYSALILLAKKSPATLDARARVLQDVFDLAERGRLCPRVVETLVLVDDLIGAAHAQPLTSEGAAQALKWVSLANDLRGRFDSLRKRGLTADLGHTIMPHGATSRLIAALSRVGRRSTAMRLAVEFITEEPILKTLRERELRVLTPRMHWVIDMPRFALGTWVEDAEPVDPRDLAVYCSILLCYGLSPNPWLHETVQAVRSRITAGEIPQIPQAEATVLYHMSRKPPIADTPGQIPYKKLPALHPLVDERSERADLSLFPYKYPDRWNSLRPLRPEDQAQLERARSLTRQIQNAEESEVEEGA